jgi:hypothetical protein
MGGEVDADTHRRQWRHWLDHEMAWFHPLGIPLYQIPSNHNTASAMAEAVYRETFPLVPANGPAGQEGLSSWIRHDDLLLVFVNTNFSGLGGMGHVEHTWLDGVLGEHADAVHKIVVGHHPIHPVNGYTLTPLWCVVPEEGEPFWDVLVRHRVLAYVCSHILAFDAQVHRGVLQILTGGAGTHDMHLGLMPEDPEYFHLVQGAIDAGGLRFQVLDTTGTIRERLIWPLPEVADSKWKRLDPSSPLPPPEGADWIAHFRVRGTPGAAGGEQTLLAGWQIWEGPVALWIGLTGDPQHLTVQLVPEPGHGAQRWDGPVLSSGEPLDLEIALHSGMGPGGVLAGAPGGPWSSLSSSANRGAERMAWPEHWAIGQGQSGLAHHPFRGEGLSVDWSIRNGCGETTD